MQNKQGNMKNEIVYMTMRVGLSRPTNLGDLNKHLYRLSAHLSDLVKNEYGGIHNVKGLSVTVEDEYGNNVELPLPENAKAV